MFCIMLPCPVILLRIRLSKAACSASRAFNLTGSFSLLIAVMLCIILLMSWDMSRCCAIIWPIIKIPHKLPEGAAFFLYLVLFSLLRFFLRGDVSEVLLGMKNGQWTALMILAIAVPALILRGIPKTGHFSQVNQPGTVTPMSAILQTG